MELKLFENNFAFIKLLHNQIIYCNSSNEKGDATEILDMLEYIDNEIYSNLNENNKNYSFIFRFENIKFIQPDVGLRWAQVFIKNQNKTEKYLNKVILISENQVVRDLIEGVLKILPHKKPLYIKNNLNESINFIIPNAIIE